jgi:hypothetical protein
MLAQGLRNVTHSVAFATLSYITGVVRVRLSLPLAHAALFVNMVLPAVMDWDVPSESVRLAEATALEQFLPAGRAAKASQQAEAVAELREDSYMAFQCVVGQGSHDLS